MNTILDGVFLGVLNGLVYSLVAVGLALVFGVVRVVNFAHAEVLMLGAYLTIAFYALSGSLLLSIVAGLVVTGVIGFAWDALVLRRLRNKALRDFELLSLVSTIGFSLLIANGVFLIAGPDNHTAPAIIEGSATVAGVIVPQQKVLAGILSLVVIAAMLVLLKRTKMGIAIRATRDLPGVVEAFGVRRDRVYAYTFGGAAMLAALAGILLAPTQYVYPYMGTGFLLKAFVIVVVAGLGSLHGVIVASVLLGVIEGVATTYSGAHAGDLMFFAAMAVVLVLRPYGLFGKLEVH
jgi:branched-chain amino acid transport system permease protein